MTTRDHTVIETARLILRPWVASDARALQAAVRTLGERPLVSWTPSTSIEQSLDLIRSVLAAPRNFAITIKGLARTSRPVGSIGLTAIDPNALHQVVANGNAAPPITTEDQLKLGFWIAAPFGGHGYMTEAVVAVLRHAFIDLGAQAVWCAYFEGNLVKERAQREAGFAPYGRQAGGARPAGGGVANRMLVRITRDEWQRGQGNDPTDISYVANQQAEARDLVANIPLVAVIRSGGQTGADRGALDAARQAGIPICGWCPAGGLAEDTQTGHTLLEDYPELVPTRSAGYVQRTAWNVRDAHATLIVAPDGLEPNSGTQMTERFAQAYGRPVLVVKSADDIDEVVPWLEAVGTGLTLNVAGPRESKLPGVYEITRQLVAALLGGELG